MTPHFKPGMVFHEDVLLSPELVEAFAVFSGDRNPLHLETDAALTYGFARPVAHGAIQSAVVSKLIGMQVPGPGAVWMNQSMEWLRPAFVGESLRVEAEIESVSSGAEVMSLLLRASNDKGEKVMQGSARVKMAAQITAGHAPVVSQETRVALVTGASRGIGAAIAKALADSGCRVVLAYRSDHTQAGQVRAEIEAAGMEAICEQADLMLEGSGESLVKNIEKRWGRVDVLVHAATQSLPSGSVMETPVQDLRSCMRMHVEAALEMSRAAVPGMVERGFGRILFIGTSFLFGAPPAKMCAYVTAKQALWGMTRCMAAELGPQQITVNMISPGMTITELTANVPQRIKEIEARKVPLRRLAVPDDTGRLATFLASEKSAYLTGQNIPLTGGPV
jgi:3-oxoacyl-[acyl-carrier protein] reductase